MRHPCPQHRPGHSSQRGHGAALHTGFTEMGGWLWSAPWGNGLWAVSCNGVLCLLLPAEGRPELGAGAARSWSPSRGSLLQPCRPSTHSSCFHEPKGPEVGLGCLSASKSFLRWTMIWNYELFSIRSRRKWSMEVRGLLSGAHLPCVSSVHCGKKLVHQMFALGNWDFLWVFLVFIFPQRFVEPGRQSAFLVCKGKVVCNLQYCCVCLPTWSTKSIVNTWDVTGLLATMPPVTGTVSYTK